MVNRRIWQCTLATLLLAGSVLSVQAQEKKETEWTSTEYVKRKFRIEYQNMSATDIRVSIEKQVISESPVSSVNQQSGGLDSCLLNYLEHNAKRMRRIFGIT